VDRYELVQKLLRLGPSYEVFAAGRGPALYTVKGSMLWAKPKLEMCEGDGGKLVATLRGNVLKTRFEIRSKDDRTLAKLAFPLFGLKKGFELSAGDVDVAAQGGFVGGDFAGKTKSGELVLSIKKKLSLKERFAIEVSEALPREVALLAAVAVDQKFFSE
jgi:uncharacterized protein YxjI